MKTNKILLLITAILITGSLPLFAKKKSIHLKANIKTSKGVLKINDLQRRMKERQSSIKKEKELNKRLRTIKKASKEQKLKRRKKVEAILAKKKQSASQKKAMTLKMKKLRKKR